MAKKVGFGCVVSDGTPIRDEVFAPPNQFPPVDEANHTMDVPDAIELDNELEKFVEDTQQIQDDNEYVRTGFDPGLLVIFNQQTFESEYNRTGTNRDANELIITFGRLGFNVEKQYIHNDLTRKEILNELNNLSLQNHSNRNCLVVAVLTHGDANNVIKAKDGQLSTNEIWEPFSISNCPSLKDKPKFFIFQACKGQRFSQHDATETDIIPNAFYTTPWEPDMLVAFAAVEGSQSYRHMFNGTWFIQEMCRNFSAFGRRDDVISLLIRTTKCVATNYYHISDQNSCMKTDSPVIIKKQMPLFVSTLTKKFYLTKSKDRDLTLRMLQQQLDIINKLEDVQTKVNLMYNHFQGKKKQKKT